MLLTVISPRPATSLASDLVRPITAALVLEYGNNLGFPSLPAMEAMLRIWPYRSYSIFFIQYGKIWPE